MRESTIEAYLVKRVKALGGEVRKVQWIGRRGAPDRRVMLPTNWRPGLDAWCFWCELKRPGEKAEPHQAREHARLASFGDMVLVIDSIEAIDQLFA